MCGICGVLGPNLGFTEKKLFQHLLYFSQTRGQDSTGLISLYKTKQGPVLSNFLKTTEAASEVLLDKDSDIRKEIDAPATQGLIGHCRFATVGEVKVANAHPFNFNNVVGVHNGTIRKTFKNSKNYGTDSEALYALINEDGVTSALNEVEAYSTAYALSWFDKRDGRVYFIRNDDRPLWFSYFAGTTNLMFASETWMLEAAAEISKSIITLNTHDLLPTKAKHFTLKKNHLLSVDPSHPSDYTMEEIKVERKVYHNPSTFQTETYNYRAGHNRGGRTYYGFEDLEDIQEESSGQKLDWLNRIEENDKKLNKKNKKKNSGATEIELIPGFLGKFITVSAYEHACADGCCNCRADLRKLPPEEAIWLDEKSLLCKVCYETEPWAKEYINSLEPMEDC